MQRSALRTQHSTRGVPRPAELRSQPQHGASRESAKVESAKPGRGEGKSRTSRVDVRANFCPARVSYEVLRHSTAGVLNAEC